MVPVTLLASGKFDPPGDSSFIFTVRVAIKPFHRHEPFGPRPCKFLAGEEGFEPPYPVLETGVLAVGRLPFTQSPRSGRRVHPVSHPSTILHQLKLFLPTPTLNLFLSPSRGLRTSAALTPNQHHRPAFSGVLGPYSP